MVIVTGLVLVVWLVQLVLTLRVRANVPPLSSLPPPAQTAWPRLSMVVPARDEGRGIEGALASKLACGYPELEVVAVDDRSRDDTGAIIDRAAAADARVAAVHVTELPDGWLGKLHAMARGLERCTGEWVLFSDADVHVERDTLQRLIGWAEGQHVDFISVFPRMHPVSPLIDGALCCALRVLALSGRTWRANDDASGIGVGVGAFCLARRSSLTKTDAIAHLRMEVADDVALGTLIKQSGARCRFFAGRDDVHLVFLDSIGAMARSTDKGGGVVGFSWWRTVLFALLPLVLDVGVPVAGIVMGGLPRALGVAALATSTLAQGLLTWHFRGPIRGMLMWPVGEVLMSALLMRAGLRAWRDQGVTWRHTFYSRETIEAGRRLDMLRMQVRR